MAARGRFIEKGTHTMSYDYTRVVSDNDLHVVMTQFLDTARDLHIAMCLFDDNHAGQAHLNDALQSALVGAETIRTLLGRKKFKVDDGKHPAG
jgi:hypothetical protein